MKIRVFHLELEYVKGNTAWSCKVFYFFICIIQFQSFYASTLAWYAKIYSEEKEEDVHDQRNVNTKKEYIGYVCFSSLNSDIFDYSMSFIKCQKFELCQ